ncbi:MAG: alanine racemase [Betaproteobacteria bacterium]|nr:alanine racemase [Betaproteobacteria bacterium]
MSRPIRADISLAAFGRNYAVAREHAPKSRVLAVVKANGYGHGIARVAKALPGVDGFATLELDGAVRLRESGFAREILLLEGYFESAELTAIAASRLATTVHCEDQLRILEKARLPAPIDLYLKINTGMNRLGFAPGEAKNVLLRLQATGAAKSITLMTHFATADGPEGVHEAMNRFETSTHGIDLPRSLANSAAILTHPRTHADTVREGIALYGASPFTDRSAQGFGLVPAMTLRSQLIAVQDVGPGDPVGYGATFYAPHAMRIGVVACGYADGYPRHAPNGTPVLVEGVRVPTAGRVSMDMITVDLTAVPGARAGSDVVLWGEGLPIDEVAHAAGTVGYELMCALAPRVPVLEVA